MIGMKFFDDKNNNLIILIVLHIVKLCRGQQNMYVIYHLIIIIS